MPCDTRIPVGMTQEQRKTQIQQALERLEAAISNGSVSVAIGTNGAVAFQGWNDRDNVTDVCAFRALTVKSSFALRRPVATAEARYGRKVNLAAVAAGTHSHDGGQTWASGH